MISSVGIGDLSLYFIRGYDSYIGRRKNIWFFLVKLVFLERKELEIVSISCVGRRLWANRKLVEDKIFNIKDLS